jgi:hypothetical protein
VRHRAAAIRHDLNPYLRPFERRIDILGDVLFPKRSRNPDWRITATWVIILTFHINPHIVLVCLLIACSR